MRKRRQVENEKEREGRLKAALQKGSDDAATEDAAVDAMVKRSIAEYGP